MVERESPLGAAYKPGRHGNIDKLPGVQLGEPRPGSIVEVVAWAGSEKAVLAAIKSVTGLTIPDSPGGGMAKADKAGFGFAPGRWLVVGQAEGVGAALREAVGIEAGTVTDLSHGRTAIRIAGERAEWVLSKFFAIDFAAAAFPVGEGRSTAHHDIFAQIQRTGKNQFDVYVFRSFARAFWTALGHAADEVGYETI
jgi:sarcosine oxidase subunit gamma